MRRKNEETGEERGRWSSKKKMAAVLRLLKGEDLDGLSRELRVNAATLSSWREVFLANGLAGLKSRDADARDEKIGQLQKALGETALNLEISREINRVYERKHGPLARGNRTSEARRVDFPETNCPAEPGMRSVWPCPLEPVFRPQSRSVPPWGPEGPHGGA